MEEDSPKEILWSTTDLDTAIVIDTLRFNVDKLKIIKDYNEGKYNRDNNPSFYYEKNKLIPPTRSGRWDFLSYNNPMAVITICASSSSVKASK